MQKFKPGDSGITAGGHPYTVVCDDGSGIPLKVRHDAEGGARLRWHFRNGAPADGVPSYDLRRTAQTETLGAAPKAVASRVVVEEEIVIRRPREVIQLQLTDEQAEALRTVLRFVGGCPETTRRGHTDAISSALDALGVRNHEEDIQRGARGIYFTDRPRPLDAGDW